MIIAIRKTFIGNIILYNKTYEQHYRRRGEMFVLAVDA